MGPNPNTFIIFALWNWGKFQAETTEMIVPTGSLFQHACPVTAASSERSTVMFGTDCTSKCMLVQVHVGR